MRYYKIMSISSLDADIILQGDWVSLNPYAVIYSFDRWFDIRQMTSSESGKLYERLHALEVTHIEGDSDHPVNRGTLCPKGAAQWLLR